MKGYTSCFFNCYSMQCIVFMFSCKFHEMQPLFQTPIQIPNNLTSNFCTAFIMSTSAQCFPSPLYYSEDNKTVCAGAKKQSRLRRDLIYLRTQGSVNSTSGRSIVANLRFPGPFSPRYFETHPRN